MMNAATEFDLGPLTWVKGEIDQALARAGEALDQYEASADPTALKFCRTHVHQVHGALAMVSLDGPALITESIEALLLGMEDERLPSGDAAIAVLRLALAALGQYLDDLLAGEPNQALRLLPAYQALAGARALPDAAPCDLFFPDLSRRPPRRADAPAAPIEADPAQTLAALKAERMRFQKGLLAWLKTPADAEAGRRLMHEALAGIEALQQTAPARVFWWIAQALLEALADPELAADPQARHVCSRIDAQIRRLLDGSGNVAERVMREALYHIARVPAGLSPAIAEVQSVFELPALLPATPATAAPHPEDGALRRLRDALATAEELWNKFCTGSNGGLAGFAEHARTCAQLTEEIGHTDLKRLGQGLGAIAHWLAEDASRFSDTVAMEVATAILLLQNAQDNFKRLGTDFAQQVDLMVARLYACIAGRPAADAGLPLLDDVTRQAQEKLLIGQVGREIQSNLAQIEQALDAFFRDPASAHDLQQLDGPIRQIGGALAMLGHFGAVNCLKACTAHIHRFAEPDYRPAQADFEAVANQLSLLGFFIDALQGGEHDFEAFAQRLQGTTPPAAAEEAPAAAPSIEAELAGQTREVQALAEALRESPADTRLQDELKQNLQALQKDADLVANREIGESAKAALAALRAGGPLDAALSALTPAVAEAPPPSVETLQLAEAPHEAIDAELLAIFLEEARDVLATIGEQQAALAASPADNAALTIVRRATHTLKGSGRMVGLTDLGEAAWQLEQTLNLWLRQDQAASPELLQMIADEHALFSAWVGHLETGAGTPPDARPLIALACRLRGVEAPAEAPPEAAAAPREAEAAAAIPATEAEEAAPPTVEPAPAALPEAEPETTPDVAPEPAAEARTTPTAEILEIPRSTAKIAEIPQPPTQTITVSPTLYDIFREEARGHLQTLLDHDAALAAEPTAPTTFEMTRAAHTLGGIAATVGLMPINRLAITLEHALLRRDGSAQPDSIEGLETVRQAIITLEEMFVGLTRQQAPEDQPQLLDALADIFPPPPAEGPAPAASAEIIPLPLAPASTAAQEAEPAVAPAPAPPQLTDEFDAQLLPIFLEEAVDLLRDLAGQIQAWRADPAGDAAPQALGRLLHTFKGSARMAGAMNLGEATHLLEARVEATRQSGPATAAFIDDLEAGCDALAQTVERLRQEPAAPEAAAEAPQPAAAPEADMEAEAGGQRASLRVRADLVDRLVNEAGELSIARTRIEGEMRSLKSSLLDLTENVIRLRRQLREIEIQAETQIQAHVAQSPDQSVDFDPLELDRFTRFQELTRFMAESVNDVATVQQNLLKNLDDANAAILAQARLNRSLQQALMGVRMLPFASQAERLYRVVRQAAKELGKRATLDIVGGQVDLDRSVLDKMLAPLEHMLRNAVTHGIEARDARLAAGKPEAGEIVIRLVQEGNEIILSITDDGRGLDTARIRARAEALGLLQPGEHAGEAALFDFIFQPGFSTAAELTQLSGRGIGMDVVRTEVAALGGRIETVSQAGQGTTFRLYLPLTLAVTQTLLVRVGSQRYALPSTMIEQVMEMKEKGLANLREQGEAVWQGNHYPFHFLPHLLGDSKAVPEAHRQYWVLLLRSGAQRVAVLVDELKGNQEVVVKNVGAQLARVVGIAGATVLGDGQVVLILNPVALASRLPAAAAHVAVPAAPQPVADIAPLPTVMIVDDSLTVRKITSRLLMREGYQVMQAKDGVDALEQLIETVPDVVLSDIEMPRMDGFDLVRNLRADARLSHLPIIMITSRTADKHRSHALELGANHYLGKPYDETELLGLVAGYCKKAP